MSETVRIYVTGGTFDKEYDERNGSLFFRDTHMRNILSLGRCQLDVEVRTLMMIDSLKMDDDDRAVIRTQCDKCPNNRIVITHGTDSMETTARMLGEAAIPDKTIVLTGAMIPYAFGSSDGLFNIGSALAFAQSLAPGVYIAMNGRYFTWENVRKNHSLGAFEELD